MCEAYFNASMRLNFLNDGKDRRRQSLIEKYLGPLLAPSPSHSREWLESHPKSTTLPTIFAMPHKFYQSYTMHGQVMVVYTTRVKSTCNFDDARRTKYIIRTRWG
jgi:hypothetical protein